MKIKYFNLCASILFFCVVKLSDAGFPLIFPFLTTGWYYKPGPVESIVLGLIVVKVLAIRLGATLYGVPYHLNDIFDHKNILPPWNTRGRRHLGEGNGGDSLVPLSPSEIKVVERILLALRRIDSHDCFIRYICQLHQNNANAQSLSPVDDTWMRIFRLRPVKSKEQQQLLHSPQKLNVTSSPWDIYEKALSPLTNCTQEYSSCPLTATDLGLDSILSGLF